MCLEHVKFHPTGLSILKIPNELETVGFIDQKLEITVEPINVLSPESSDSESPEESSTSSGENFKEGIKKSGQLTTQKPRSLRRTLTPPIPINLISQR